jgi:hypothetical protein
MALVIEDGTGLANAESYISVTDATAYHTARGNSAWAALATDTVREQLLRKATDYMREVYRLRWKGVRESLTQALDWPRFNVSIDDVSYGNIPGYVPAHTVPAEVKSACAELALKAATGDLAPDLKRQVVAKVIGPIRTEYQPGAPEFTRFRAIDLMLKIYLESTGATVKMVRS